MDPRRRKIRWAVNYESHTYSWPWVSMVLVFTACFLAGQGYVVKQMHRGARHSLLVPELQQTRHRLPGVFSDITSGPDTASWQRTGWLPTSCRHSNPSMSSRKLARATPLLAPTSPCSQGVVGSIAGANEDRVCCVPCSEAESQSRCC